MNEIHKKVILPITDFLNDSRSVGIILIGCTIISLLLSNLNFTQNAYIHLWENNFTSSAGVFHLPENLLHWINDVLMAFFFFLVGMEIKRELIVGELASIRKSLLPILAALGGMLVPAAIFALFNTNTPFHHGWGIPMATDIAFSLGILSLLGKKVPVQLKIFLAALAIIDDLGAVVTIAIFYTSQLSYIYLALAAGITGIVITLNILKVKNILFYAILGILLWYCLFNSGIHPTIAGVLMAFCMPLKRLAKLEHLLYHPVNFIIMPLFALANTAIILPTDFSKVYTSPITYGIMLGLFLGKPIGIFLFSWISTKLGIASMPSNTSYKQLFGVGILGGIGFTMSIFTTSLAFNVAGWETISKVSIICGSVLAAVSGYYYLYRSRAVAVKSHLPLRAVEKEAAEEPALEVAFN